MAEDFNWGIIGPGRIAKKFAAAVTGISKSRIYAVASKSTKNIDLKKKEFGADIAYSSYEELVNDPNVDAIYIATTHNFHFENAKLCLEQKKPVLIEKPFAVTAMQARDLVNIAKIKHTFLMEAMWTRFLPIYKVVSGWLDKKRIGDVRLVRSSLGFSARRDKKDRFLNPNLSGGATLDLGIYTTAASQFAFRKQPATTTALGYVGETGVDEAISVTLDYGNGAFSQFNCSLITRLPGELEIIGSEGSIDIQPVFNKAEFASLNTNGKTKNVHKSLRVNGFEYQIEETQKQIRKGRIESPKLTHQNMIDNISLLDRIRDLIGVHYEGID